MREIYDACDATGQKAALGGFFALPPEFSQAVPAASLNMLVSSQLTQVFGEVAGSGDQHIQDWAGERFTCSKPDLTSTEGHPDYGDLKLRRQLWNGKLYLGGSETVGCGGGYLEGALDAAARIQRALVEPNAPARHGTPNDACLAQFGAWGG